MTLPNLAALADKATPGKWRVERDTVEGSYDYPTDRDCSFPWRIKGVCDFADEEASEETAALIAASPDMAALLIECAEALVLFASTSCVHESGPTVSGRHPRDASECRYCIARAALARLADFDGGLQA